MLAEAVFTVPSASTGGHRTVTVVTAKSADHAGERYLRCDCPAWKFAIKAGGCKHVKAVAAMAGVTLDGVTIR